MTFPVSECNGCSVCVVSAEGACTLLFDLLPICSIDLCPVIVFDIKQLHFTNGLFLDVNMFLFYQRFIRISDQL